MDVDEVLLESFGRQQVVDLNRALESDTEGFSLTEERDGQVVGYVRLSRCWVDAPDAVLDVLSLSPLGVHPRHQRRGIGKALVARALERADAQEEPLVFLEGDPRYYGPQGFRPAAELGFTRPSVRVPEGGFQVVTLSSYRPEMAGAFVYCSTFWQHDCVGLRNQ